MLRYWLVLVVIAGVVFWQVGEAHKTDCINAGKVNCSLLPWSGSVPGSSGGSGGVTLQGVGSSAGYVGSSIGGSLSGSAHSIP